MRANVEKGRLGENVAVNYIIEKNYIVLERNFRAFTGEIDIIAEKDGEIVFIEVKYRNNIKNGYPREAVNKAKQKKIKNTALAYIEKYGMSEKNFRFDVIEILGNNIEHIENAFW